MHYNFALLALFVGILSLPVPGLAQSDVRKTSRAAIQRAAAKKPANIFQRRRISAELERHQEFLRGVTARFQAVAVHDITPLLKYSYVWTALRDNRAKIARPDTHLSAAQTKLLAESYDRLEKEVVATFGDHQLAILNDVLELNDQQLQEIQTAVEDDLNLRRDLLKASTVTGRDFTKQLATISVRTESRILAVLFPEQRKTFDKQLNFHRNRLVA